MTDAEIFANGVQSISCSLSQIDGTEITITNADILQGGFKITRSCASGDKLALGEAVANTLNMTLLNTDGKFDDVVFAGAHLYVKITATYNGERSSEYVLGYYTIDTVPVYGKQIEIVAYDILPQFDETLTHEYAESIIKGSTLVNALSTVLDGRIYNLASIKNLPNANYKIASLDEGQDNITRRNLAKWICEYLGCYMFTYDTKIVVRQYSLPETPTYSITKDNRYSCSLNAETVTIKGIKRIDGETEIRYGQELEADETDYCFEIQDNPIALADIEGESYVTVLENIFSQYMSNGKSTFTYMPMTATVFPMPYLNPGTAVTVVDGYRTDTSYTSIITSITFGLNCTMALSSIGKSVTEEGYASLSEFSSTQIAYLQRYINKTREILGLVDKEELASGVEGGVETANSYTDTKVSGEEKYVLKRAEDIESLNRAITTGLGFYATTLNEKGEEPAVGDTLIYYWHDKENLKGSSVVYKFNQSGVAWTKEYTGDDETTVWTTGITREGDAVFRNLSVVGITASEIKTGVLKSNDDDVSVLFDLDAGSLTMKKGEINLGTGDLQTDITATKAQLGNPLYLTSAYFNTAYGVLSVSTDIQGGVTVPALAIGTGVTPGSTEWGAIKEIRVGEPEQTDLIVNCALKGTTNVNDISIGGNVTSNIKVTDNNNITIGGTGALRYKDDSNYYNIASVQTGTNPRLNIGGNVPTVLQNTNGVYVGISTADANELTDWVYAQGTATINGLTWNYRKWHSGVAECFCNAQSVSMAWTGFFTNTSLSRGTATVTLPFTFRPCYTAQMATCDNKYLLGRSYCPATSTTGSNSLHISVWATEDEGTGTPKVNLYCIGTI